MRVGLLIQPGLETRHPHAAAKRYLKVLEKQDKTLKGKRILVLGYGGYLGLGDALLKMGAKHVTLLDPYARSYERENLRLATKSNPFISSVGKQVIPNPDYLTLHHKPINEVSLEARERVDYVLSSSVYEHLTHPLEVTRHLSNWTNADGSHIHFIDLRDHFFRYPFEMLSYSEATWRKFLNPSSHLNRFRIWSYEAIFQQVFEKVNLEIVEHDFQAYRKNVHRIRQEYISGDENRDAATKITIFASLPTIST
jgi:hypothetical protein